MTWKRLLIGLVIAALLIAGGVFTYLTFFAPPDEEAATVPTPAADLASRADTVAVDIGTDSVSAEGQVVPLRHALLAFTGSGPVVELLVEEGAAVEAGQPILRLDTADQDLALREAEAALSRAQANLTAAQAGTRAAETGVQAGELAVQRAEAQLALVTAEPRPEEIALNESNIALATARISQAAAAQAQVLEGAPNSAIESAQAELAAAEAQAIPARLRLEQLRLQDNPDADAFDQAQRDYNAAQAAIDAARVALEELEAGATSAQRQAASSGVAAASAQRAAAESELDLLLAGSQAEQVAIAEAGVTQAQASLAEAQVVVEQARAAVAQAEAEVSRAQAAVDAAQTALDDRTLIAPFAGTVADLAVDVGEVVNPGVPVATLADLSGWRVETTDLTELDVVAVAVGDPVEVRPDALPDTTLTGTVTDVSTVSQEVRGDITYTVTVALDDAADAPLRWGMTVFVTVDTSGR